MALRALPAEAGEQELVARRTICGKTFLRPDGKVRVANRIGAQHYPQGGQMVEIDDTPETADGKVWTVRNAPYQIAFDAQALTLTYTSKQSGQRVISLEGMAAVEAPRQVGQSIFVKVHPELELELRCRAVGVEIFKRLLGPTAPKTLAWNVEEVGKQRSVFDPARIMAHDNMEGKTNRPQDMLPRRRAEIVVAKEPDVPTPEGRKYRFTERVTGRTAQINKNSAARAMRNEIAYPVVIDVTVTEDIVATDDDGTGSATNWYTTNYTYTSTSGQRMAAWRWQTVDVPQGQTLDSATFSINVTTNASSGGCVLKGENVDDAAAWTVGSANTPVTMSATTASASFAPSGTGIKTLDVTSIVQEIINRAGWTNNNDIRIGTTSPFSGGSVIFEDYNAAGTDEGQLVVVYSTSSVTGPLIGGRLVGGGALMKGRLVG